MFTGCGPMKEHVTPPRHGDLHPVPGSTRAAELLGDLAAVLWQERELLEDLLYALTQQHHLLASGEIRWLPRADASVAAAARAIQEQEVFRAIEVETLVAVLGIGTSPTLAQIAAAAGEPWAMLLQDHLTALRTLTEEIEQATARNRTLLIAGERSTREALEQVGVIARSEHGARYDERGSIARRSSSVLDAHA